MFDQLTGLLTLNLYGNLSLTALRPGVFDQLTQLTTLDLHHNLFTDLPAGCSTT